MEELQDIVANYPLIQPAMSFVVGALIGTATRLFQNYVTDKDRTKKAGWLPGGSFASGIVMASQTHSGAGIYVADVAAALVGDYLATRIIDKVIYKR
ncbi:MAG TPA: hypothetical protein VJJ23_05995 [Candidatus Nanoarchaeia archaeon]|nr:hypothetical protein [Candidatus Nanoarchaeia archaeon]